MPDATGPARQNTDTTSAPHFKVYATSVATDLIAEGGKACRWIFVPGSGAGTLIVENLRGEQVTIPAAGGDKDFVVQAVALVGGTATNFMVCW